MRLERFEWSGAVDTAATTRGWAEGETGEEVTSRVIEIEKEVRERGDEAVLALTAELDATESLPDSLRVSQGEVAEALAALDGSLRKSLELAAENIRAVAEAQVDRVQRLVPLPGGQNVTVREVPVSSAGLYAPGGRAAYPSSVLMCAIPARVAGVERLALASPPGSDGKLNSLVLAAAALCEVDEVYAMGGAQAIYALALGTETVDRVDVIAGPGNAWVQEAKRRMYGFVGLDSYAGPSELMVVAGPDTDPEWAALDLCAQAEHGGGGPLLAAAVEVEVLEAIEAATERVAERSDAGDATLALVCVPSIDDAIELANAFAPEHLELLAEAAAPFAERVTTAGCVFAGSYSATAFGDYVAGSNHVLPTAGAGRFTGPLGPSTFRRKISTVQVSAAAAAKLAPHVDTLARAEGFPVHGESAMIRR
ncbi:MAG: histidinol dehydrogenase [Solirubrobacterales bacterium]|jgi:histidinol dehydrogenase|nr:histidinol dehydrogenase [Solirubrobacterales bacterium]